MRFSYTLSTTLTLFLVLCLVLSDKSHQYYNYKAKPSFSVQHLMMLEKARQTTSFTDEAIRLVDSSEVAALKISVAYIVRHAIVFTPELLPQQLDRLSERFFSKRETKARIMAQRYLRPSSTKKE